MSATWVVNGQRQTSQMLAGGDFVAGQNITFTTGGGHTGTVFVPLTQLGNTAFVKAAIQARADALDAIGALTSTTPTD
jgi:hypothetical protein